MMSICDAPFAHAYDPEKNVLANVIDVQEYVEIMTPQFPHTCFSGFIPSTDMSTLVLLCGTIAGLYFWSNRPRLSGAAITGCVVSWAWWQFASLRIIPLIEEVQRGLSYEEAEELRQAHSIAASHQAAFEFVAFFVLPIVIALFSRNRRHRLAIQHHEVAKPSHD